MSTNEARQLLSDSLQILSRRSGRFRSTARFVQRLEGKSASARKALESARISCGAADEQSRQTQAAIRARQP